MKDIKDKKILVSETDLRKAIRDSLEKENNESILLEQSFLKGFFNIFSDPSALKISGKLPSTLTKMGMSDDAAKALARYGIRTPEMLYSLLRWVYSPASTTFRALIARNPIFLKRGVTCFGDKFQSLDAVRDLSKTWDDVIPDIDDWINLRIVKKKKLPDNYFVQDMNSGNLFRLDAPGLDFTNNFYPHIDGRPLPLNTAAGGRADSFKQYRLVQDVTDSTGARRLIDVFDDTDADGILTLGEWKKSVGLDADLEDVIKLDGTSIREISEALPPMYRAGLIGLYYGVAVPAEIALWTAALDASPIVQIIDEFKDLIEGDKALEDMFSERIYGKVVEAGANIAATNMAGKITVGGGSFYMEGAQPVVDPSDADKYKRISAAYRLLLKISSNIGAHSIFENFRALHKAFLSSSSRESISNILSGDDEVTDLEALEAYRAALSLKDSDPYQMIEFGENLKTLKAILKVIYEEDNIAMADFSYRFALEQRSGRASTGTKHFFREFFGEETAQSPGEIGLAALEYGPLIGLGKIVISAVAGKGKTAAELEAEKAKAKFSLEAPNIAKNAAAAQIAAGEINDIEIIIEQIYKKIKDLPTAYLWDLTSGEPIRKNKELTEVEIEKLAEDGLRTASDEEVANIIGKALADYVNNLNPQGPPQTSTTSGSQSASANIGGVSEEQVNDKVRASTATGENIRAYSDALAVHLVNQKPKFSSIKDRVMRSLTISDKPRSTDWPRRSADEEFDASFGDGFVSPTLYEFAEQGNFEIPKLQGNESFYQENARILIAGFSKLGIINGIDPSNLAGRIKDGKDKSSKTYNASAKDNNAKEEFYRNLYNEYLLIARTLVRSLP